MTETTLGGALAARLGEVLGADCRIADLHQLTGGASRDTWSFDAIARSGDTHQLVLRRDPESEEDPARMRREADALREGARLGVPVPEVVDCNGESAAGLGNSYLITTRMRGEALPRKLLRDDRYREARKDMAYQMGRALARIHRMEPNRIPSLPRAEPLDEAFSTYIEEGAPLPSLDLAFRWLFDHRPDDTRKTVVHGDFRTGNVLVGPDRMEAVLDWELVHVGDPMEDLGWLCTPSWRFGSPEPVGGFGSREDLFRGYADECGIEPDPAAVEWWEVFGSVRWALMCRMQAGRAYAGGSENELELLAIGRRVAECEHDLLEALGWPTYDATHDGTVDPPDELFGRPHLDELLGSVRRLVLDVGDQADPITRYRTKVAANLLELSMRQYLQGDTSRARQQKLLAHTGFTSETELALSIRSGEVDPRDEPVANFIAHGVAARIAVVNPRY